MTAANDKPILIAGPTASGKSALAVRLARHSAAGWDNPALPDDYSETAQLLNLSIGAAKQLVQDIDT